MHPDLLAREEAVASFPTTNLRADRLSSVTLVIIKASHEEHRSRHRFQVALYDQETEEVCSCVMEMGEEPDTLNVDGGLCKIVATISPSQNTQVYFDEQLYLEKPDLPFGAFVINLPTVRPAGNYVVEFSFFKRHSSSHSEEQYVKCCESTFYTVKNTTTGSIQYPLSKIKFTGILQRSFSWKVITYFEDLSDNGFSVWFQRDRERLEAYVYERSGYEELLALVLLTECDALLLRHEIEGAILLAKRACHISSNHNCPNDLFIQGYAKVAFAARHRFKGEFEAADEELASALEIFQQLEPSEYSCSLYYNMGACAMAKSAAGIEVNAEESCTTEEAFRRALEHWESQTQIKTMRRPQRIHQRQISYFLKSTSGKAPDLELVVPEDDLNRANAELAMFERDLLDGCPPWPMLLFYLNKTDYFIRTGNVEEGFKANYQSLVIARKHGFQREGRGAQGRACCLEAMRRQKHVSVSEISSGERSPRQYPPGPPEGYDFMQDMMPLTAENHHHQLPVEEVQNFGERLPEQHPHEPNEDDKLMEATGGIVTRQVMETRQTRDEDLVRRS